MSSKLYLHLQDIYSKAGYKYWTEVLTRLENIIYDFENTTKSKFPVFAVISSLLYVPHISIKDFEPNDYDQLLPIIYTNNPDILIKKMKEYYITQQFILNTFESFENGFCFIFKNSGLKQCIIISSKYKNFDSFKINSKFSNKQIEIMNNIYYIPIIYKMLIESRFKNYLTTKYMLTIENQIWENMSLTKKPYYFNKNIDNKILDIIKKNNLILSGSISDIYSGNKETNITSYIKYPIFAFHNNPEEISDNIFSDLNSLQLEKKPKKDSNSSNYEDEEIIIHPNDIVEYGALEFKKEKPGKSGDKSETDRSEYVKRDIVVSKLNCPYFPYYITMTNIYANKELIFILCDYPKKSLIRYNTDSNGFKYTDPTSSMISLFMIAWMFKKSDIEIYKQIYQTIYNIRSNIDKYEIGKEFYGYKSENIFIN